MTASGAAAAPAALDPLVPRPLDLPTAVPPWRAAADLAVLDEAKIVAAPADPADRPRWREALAAWRADARERLGYVGGAYDAPGAAWAQRCFTVAQVWLWDELFFSHGEQRFTSDRFLADARDRFGGLDAVVLWHAYPVIGIDERNQWDWYRDVPGLRDVVAALHAAGVAVFVDYNPWDVGTRRGRDDVTELAELVRELGVDGVFLDTLRKADPALVAALQRARPGFVLEGESKLALARIGDHATSWAQWFADSEVPGVLRAHWFERRHMQHHVRRWHRDHGEELASAWLNGVGVMVWEVVFGVWVGWNRRDAATLRRMLPVLRGLADVLREGEWTPLVDLGSEAEAARVHGSLFDDGVTRVLLLANRGPDDFRGALDLPGGWWPLHDGGADGSPRPEPPPPWRVSGVSGEPHGAPTAEVPAGGVAALVSVADGDVDGVDPAAVAAARARVTRVRETVAGVRHEPDASFLHRRARRSAPPPPTGPRDAGLAADAVVVPAGEHVLTVRYRMRETGMYEGAPFVDEWKPLPPRLHDYRTLERVVRLAHPVRVAAREVTVGELARFRGEPDAVGDGAERPATGVTLAEARGYAASVGGRLPTEDEWQLAATAPGFRRLSPAVWSWTESEHTDGRTRFVMLKGGADHSSVGSDWYVEGGVRGPEHALKYLLPGLGLDASPSIGFRVCWDEEVPA